MAFFPMFWIIEGLAAIQASIFAVHQRFTFQTAVLHPDFPGRLPTIVILPSAFISVKRGLTKLGLLSGIFPSATSRSPISSAVMPPGSPLVKTSKIIALRLGDFGLTWSYASRRSLSAMLMKTIPFYPTNASFCCSYGWADPSTLLNTTSSRFTGRVG